MSDRIYNFIVWYLLGTVSILGFIAALIYGCIISHSFAACIALIASPIAVGLWARTTALGPLPSKDVRYVDLTTLPRAICLPRVHRDKHPEQWS